MIHIDYLQHQEQNIEIRVYYSEEQIEDIHLFIEGTFRGHLTMEMLNILSEEKLSGNVNSFIAACIPCGDCQDKHEEI